MTFAKPIILLTIVMSLTNAAQTSEASGQTNISKKSSRAISDPFKLVTPASETNESHSGDVAFGMMSEDLIALQCSCGSLLNEPAVDIFSYTITDAYLKYETSNQKAEEMLQEYLDLCEMARNTVENFNSIHCGYLDYITSKARRTQLRLIEEAISSRANLAELSSPEIVQMLDDKHGWSPLDDKRSVEPKAPETKKIWGPR
jgi:hypothetical protein